MTDTVDDIVAIKGTYPYLVTRIADHSVSLEMADWATNTINNAMLVVSRDLVYVSGDIKFRVLYGFKTIDDAVAFKLLFP